MSSFTNTSNLSLESKLYSSMTLESKESLPSTPRSVKFKDGTAGGRETVLAVSISRFDHLENLGYTEYTIQVTYIIYHDDSNEIMK